ncbi:MAG: type VI secretion system tube protein Hcp [Gemmatimonadota bacterium]|nr:type VI secretion system tube protein Hcp [Gemmatimonadota bacterium]MDQ8166505.1 type VI secretion system tube protein Hcp [Gemmatimonadota bacterium]MDQ8172385.1 type VI secretion system tube protein Hcp [Gemmatimonadota bacterium]
MAFDAYLFIDTIEGESTAKIKAPYGKPMEIFSFSFGASNPASMGTQGGGGGAGKVSLSSFNFMKKSDNASGPLFQACATGTHFKKAQLILRKAGGTQEAFVQYDFEEVYVESIQWSGSSGGDDSPTESLSLAFGKITGQYMKQDGKGAMSKGTGFSWDVRTATV